MNESKLFSEKIRDLCKPWGHLNKEMESFRGQNSLCDTIDVWDGGCALIFCLLVTTSLFVNTKTLVRRQAYRHCESLK